MDEARRFFLDLDPPRDRPLTVVCGGVERCRPDYAVSRESFPYFSIELVVQGRGTLRLGGESHALLPGRVFTYGPGIAQEIAADPEDPPVKYFVDFAGRGAPALLEACQLPPGTATVVSAVGEVQGLFEELIRNGRRQARHSAEICRALLECLAYKTAERRAPVGEGETLAFARYEQCRAHIEAHCRELRSLDQVAAECHINAAYLCRLFQRFDHQSPYQFLLRLKMNQAAALLQEPGKLVKQVAEAVGFGDPFHFSRAFKGVFGLSPDAFRRMR